MRVQGVNVTSPGVSSAGRAARAMAGERHTFRARTDPASALLAHPSPHADEAG
ncbi:MAG: hypothetical protein WA966_10915 [Ornithinimicrobium sp.]